MPIPKRKPSETSKDFIRRCMVNPTMISEYPDKNQRFAICKKQLDY